MQSPFIQQVNAAWKSKNDDEIRRLADAQAAKSPDDPEPLAILVSYDSLVKGNDLESMKKLNELIELLKKVRPTKVAGVQEYRDNLLKSAGKNPTGHTRTPQQLEKMHELFPNNFPAVSLLLLIFVPDPAIKNISPVGDEE